MDIKFEVPYNGDSNIIEYYISKKENISMVYGRAEDSYPQGRKTHALPPITLENIFSTIVILQKHNIKFNYLLNGSCFSNREYNKEYRQSFLKFVKTLSQHGISIITLGNPFLIEVVKNEIQNIDIFGSVLLEVDCATRLKMIAQMGIKYICLSKTLLKNFHALPSVIKICDSFSINPVLLANDPCLHHCALTHYHNSTLSHLTGGGQPCLSYCRLHCTKNFLENPREIISSSFIRPEDTEVYNRFGFGLFKICDRKQTTEWIQNALQAYINCSYQGNLGEIMAPWNKHGGSYGVPRILTAMDFQQHRFSELREHLRFTPFIENRELDGYLDHWLSQKQMGCGNEECTNCGYCNLIAKKAVKINPSIKQTLINNLELALKYTAT